MSQISIEAEKRQNDAFDTTAPEYENDPASPKIRYQRGWIDEQYVFRQNSIEQQFVIPRRDHPALNGGDLIITGRVESDGAFETVPGAGWQWRDKRGAITLGDVTVFDANGAELPATMRVTANETRIEVDGEALLAAEYPVTIDPEIGANDFRISDMGPDGTGLYNGGAPAGAYNSFNDEYLIAWVGDDNTPPYVNNEHEIFGQRIYGDLTLGDEVGDNDFRVSDMGPHSSTSFQGDFPSVAWNSTDNEYLVVWAGDDNISPLVNNEIEVFGQRIPGDRALGNGALADNENEAFGQRLKFGAEDDVKSYVFLANDVTINRTDASGSSGAIHSNGDIIFEKGDPSNYDTGLSAVGNVSIEKENVINGDVTSGGSVVVDGAVNAIKISAKRVKPPFEGGRGDV